MSLPPATPAPFWPIAAWGVAFILIGAAILVWPHRLIRLYVAMLKPMRRVFGRNLIDWEIGLLEGRIAPILVRLFGLFVIVAGGSIFFYRFNA
jgi:hypothetical protein